MMGSIRFRLCWCHSEDLFVCFGAKPTQRAWMQDRKWRREGRSQRRRRESVEKGGRREQSSCDSCPEKHTVNRRRQWEDGSRAVKRWVSIPSGFVEVSCKYSLAIACKWTESCTKLSHILPPSCAWSWSKSVFVRLFFSSTSNIPMIRICEIDIGNLKTRNFTKLVQARNFLLPLR